MSEDKGPDTWKWRIAKAGLTQRAFAQRIDMLPSQLSAYLTTNPETRMRPSQRTEERVEKLLDAFGV